MADAVLRVRADTTQAERALGNLQTALGALATGAALKGLADIADVSTNLRNRLQTVATAQNDVNGTLKSLTQIANNARTPLADTGQLYFTIARAAGDLGVNNEQALRATELISKSLSLSGTSAQAASGALVQLGQALAQDSVRGDELNSILEGMPDLAQAMADKFNVTVGALKSLGSQGKITGRDLLDSVAAAADRIETNFNRALPTISSAFTVLQNSITNFVGELDRATGGSGTAANAILRIASSIDTLGKNLETIKNIIEIGLIIAITVLAAKFAAGIGVIVGGFRAMYLAGSSLALTITKTAQSFSAWWRQTPRFAEFGGRVGSLGKLFSELGDRLKYVTPLLTGITTTLVGVGAAIATYWDRAVNRVKEYLGLTTTAKTDQESINQILEQQAAHFALQAQARQDIERRTKKQVEEDALINKAIRERDQTLQTMLRDAEQQVVLAGLQGTELERQTQLYRYENALIKEIRNEAGDLIGITSGLTAEERRRVLALIEQNASLERQKKLYEDIQQAGQSVIREAAVGEDPRIKVEQKFIEDKIKLENYFIQNSLMTEEQYEQTLSQLTRQYEIDRISAEMQLQKRKFDEQYQLENAALIRSTEIFNIRLGQLKAQAELEFTNWNQELIRQNELFTQQQSFVQRRMEMEFNAANQQMILQTQIYDLQVSQQEKLNQMKQSMFQQELQRQGFTLEQAKTIARDRAEFEKKSELEKTQFALEQTASIFTNLGKENRKAFEAAKAFNIANAIMNTYLGATKAIATYPPPFNIIAAGAVVAAGLAQVATIRAQTYSGRALGGPMVGGQRYIVGERGPELITAPSGGANVVANDQLGGTTNITFNINAVDTRGMDQLLAERKGIIINMVRQAMQDRGRVATV